MIEGEGGYDELGPEDDSNTVGVIEAGFVLRDKSWNHRIYTLRVYGDQPLGDKIATNRARRRLTLSADSLPVLLRKVADFMDQEGLSTLHALAVKANASVAAASVIA